MSGKNQFEMLLSPCNIGKMQVKNRIIKTAAEQQTHDIDDFHVNQKTIEHVEALAKGGVGMIIFWNAYVDYPLGARMREGLRIDDNEITGSAYGSGAVDATLKAIESIVKADAVLALYSVNNITNGTDAQGDVTVRLDKAGRIVNGLGADTDIVIASAKAYINAVNKLNSPNQRCHPQQVDV